MIFNYNVKNKQNKLMGKKYIQLDEEKKFIEWL